MGNPSVDFNKEILFGEIGALIGAPLFSFIFSREVMSNPDSVSAAAAVVGAIVGACVFWLASRIYDKRKKGSYSIKNLGNDIAYFTPAAFLLTLVIYYPTLFFLSSYMQSVWQGVLGPVIFSQLVAFVFLLIALNVYRILLGKYYGKKL